jgi:hypothetical protein
MSFISDDGKRLRIGRWKIIWENPCALRGGQPFRLASEGRAYGDVRCLSSAFGFASSTTLTSLATPGL